MKINANGKETIIITAVAAGTGAVIYGVSKLIGLVKNRKKDPEAETPEENVTEEGEEKEEEK